MPVRPVIAYPDPRLAYVAEPIERFDSELGALATDLVDTIRSVGGLGLTAPHVGVPLRLVVLTLDAAAAPEIYVNPLVVWSSDTIATHPEGSVSMPGVTDTVDRPSHIRVAYASLDGGALVRTADGLRAVCLQHEIDQLDGIFWIDRLSRLRRDRLLKRWRRTRQS
ncbi:peptide deformylase [Mongoliimonas terrestris]|uniref:peptide deformylase n=1 Tax=Mongoliimonas terrestris TaxID=1709001 RepID=UPI0009497F1C|nr:peptide deformylase [Mongoliimonas terrestris]